MSERPLYACRVTRGLLATSRADLQRKVAESLSELFVEWSQDPEEATAALVHLADGSEITLHAEPYQDGMSCNACIERNGIYKIDACSTLIRRVPDTIAQAAIAGSLSLAKLIGKGLLDGVRIKRVIRKGIVYENGKPVDDLTKVQSTPPWSKDESLSVSYDVEDEGFQPIALHGTDGMKQISNCLLTQRFLDEGAEDFLACYRYVIEMGETIEGDEEHIYFNRKGRDHSVNGYNVDFGEGRVLHIHMVVAERERYYLRDGSIDIHGIPEAVRLSNHVGKPVNDFIDSVWPPKGTKITAQKSEGDVLALEFKAG